uniref:Major facilitator superfamily domain-containing protein 2B isoform X11 n=1 Tax=Phascolarctos cinereus TaxID=38626 RepID=A0A6P5JHJ0_PHACI|nr:major facilitator superfamily domain-containing protein 2B isoform X11 [Phascolarctos cinereus]
MATSTRGPGPQPLEKEEDLPQDRPSGHLSVISKLCYSIGGAPNQAASSAAAFYLQLFLLDVAGIPAVQASLVVFVGKLLGAAADPAAGFIISRSPRTALGRLTPWILGCSPFLALTYFFLWFLPPIGRLQGLWYAAFYGLFQALSTLLQVPYSALTMFLTQDQEERDSATAYRMTMEMAGTLTGATVHGLIVAGAHKAPRCPEANLTDPLLSVASSISPHTSQLYMIAAGVIAGTYPLCTALLALGTTEEDDGYILEQRRVPFFQGLSHTLQHQPYQKLVASFLFISAAVQVQQSYLVLFCTHAAPLHSHMQNLVLLVLVAAVLSTPFWEWFLQRVGKKAVAYGIGVCNGAFRAPARSSPHCPRGLRCGLRVRHQHRPGLAAAMVHVAGHCGRLQTPQSSSEGLGDHLLLLLRLLHKAIGGRGSGHLHPELGEGGARVSGNPVPV